MLLCCLRRNIEASCHTRRRRLPSKTNSVAHQRLVSSTRWSVAVKCIALHVHSTPWSQILAQNRDFCLPHLRSTTPLGGSRRSFAMTFGMEKLEWCGYRQWKNFEDIFIDFDKMYERDKRTDGHRMTAKAALGASIARQKPTNCAGAQVKLVWIQGQL